MLYARGGGGSVAVHSSAAITAFAVVTAAAARQPGSQTQARLGLCFQGIVLCQKCSVLVWGARRTGDVVVRDRVAADGRGLRDGREDLGDCQQEAGHQNGRGGRQPKKPMSRNRWKHM